MEDLQLFVNSIVDLFRVEYRLRPTDQVMALLKSDGDKVFRVPLQSLEHVTSASIMNRIQGATSATTFTIKTVAR